MTTRPVSAGRPIVIQAGPVTLSALISEPRTVPPRATVVALHGGGMRAGYFDGQAHPDISLLAIGARLGYTVLALDRPGYGRSAAQLPDGACLADQAEILTAGLRAFARIRPVGAGVFLLAHSYGGKLALTAAAANGDGLLGLDISGCGSRYAVAPADLAATLGANGRKLNWGPLRLYPPDTFRASATVVAPLPASERDEAARWPELFPAVAARVRVPVRFTFAEHECWWRHDDEALAALTSPLAAPRVIVDHQRAAGHNISLGWAARAYHLRALGFLEECLRFSDRATVLPQPREAR